jgi:uncharacterized protein
MTVTTLGVDDLATAVRFYRVAVGFPTEGIVGQEFEYGAVARMARRSWTRARTGP